jgi:hypothetical protein
MQGVYSWNKIYLIKLRQKFYWLLLIICFNPCTLFAQILQPKVYQGVELSDVVIKDVREGFDVEAFINLVKKDSSFYKAFKSMKLISFTQYNDMQFYGKKKQVITSYNSISKQSRKGSCREMTIENEKVKGDFYGKRKSYNYFTAELFDKLFLLHEKRCGENNIVNNQLSTNSNQRINQLKELIFRPGQSIKGVPGVGSKVGIFEPDQQGKYKFVLSKKELNGVWCYVFKAIPLKNRKGDVVIDALETWFRESDYVILARNYSLSYKTLVYDFKVDMKVKLKQAGKLLIPYEIFYDGDWHLFGKKREQGTFSVILTDIH